MELKSFFFLFFFSSSWLGRKAVNRLCGRTASWQDLSVSLLLLLLPHALSLTCTLASRESPPPLQAPTKYTRNKHVDLRVFTCTRYVPLFLCSLCSFMLLFVSSIKSSPSHLCLRHPLPTSPYVSHLRLHTYLPFLSCQMPMIHIHSFNTSCCSSVSFHSHTSLIFTVSPSLSNVLFPSSLNTSPNIYPASSCAS